MSANGRPLPYITESMALLREYRGCVVALVSLPSSVERMIIDSTYCTPIAHLLLWTVLLRLKIPTFKLLDQSIETISRCPAP